MVSCSPINPFGMAQEYLDIAKLEEISNQRTVNIQGIVVNVAPFLEGVLTKFKIKPDGCGSKPIANYPVKAPC
ncbi:hypothetical protein NON20_23480 [Synechocystis sp. B12]|nr:hypothetical protein NON20_23480 [Synechocystis sp. B12]